MPRIVQSKCKTTNTSINHFMHDLRFPQTAEVCIKQIPREEVSTLFTEQEEEVEEENVSVTSPWMSYSTVLGIGVMTT